MSDIPVWREQDFDALSKETAWTSVQVNADTQVFFKIYARTLTVPDYRVQWAFQMLCQYSQYVQQATVEVDQQRAFRHVLSESWVWETWCRLEQQSRLLRECVRACGRRSVFDWCGGKKGVSHCLYYPEIRRGVCYMGDYPVYGQIIQFSGTSFRVDLR